MDWTNVFYIHLLFTIAVCQVEKSSLSFVIDDTGSMGDDIEQVKQGTNLVFDTVMRSNASQIENFILITFNDPGEPMIRTVTKDRGTFKRELAAIHVTGGGDCPELAMGGIQLALERSLPGSYIYVFTDASAKDAGKVEAVQNMAIKKQTQIVFLLTGRCNLNDNDPKYKSFYNLAEATSGQVFHMRKQDIGKILNYVSETIRSRKSVVISRKFPPGYDHHLTVPVDSAMKDVVISVAGHDPRVDVTAPDGSKPHVTKVVKLPEVVAVKITTTIPGNYTSTLGSKSETSVVLTATTELQFKHGFSGIIPTTIKDTDTRPIPGDISYLSIELQSSEEDKILDTVQILDIKENVVMELPLKLVDKIHKLYLTERLNPPNHLFKIAVKGHDTKYGSSFKRVGPTPIEPQKPALVKIEYRSPTVTVDGGPNFEVEYNQPFKVSCKVNGYPKPDIIWIDEKDNVLSSTVSSINLPYDYINILEIKKATTNSNYKCKAVNGLGEAKSTVILKVIRKDYFSVLEIPTAVKQFAVFRIEGKGSLCNYWAWTAFHLRPQDDNALAISNKTIEYKHSDSVKCLVDAYPPAEISWFANGKELHTNDDIEISSNGSELKIKDMRGHLSGNFICKAKNDRNMKIFHFPILLSGFEKPVIDKTKNIVHVLKGNDAKINCSLNKGLPKPNITWLFTSQDSGLTNKIDKYGEVIYLNKTDTNLSGSYKCIAKNDAGQDKHETELIVGYAPTIKRDVTRQISRQGEKTTLKCEADGIPKPKVDWHLNGAKIVNDSNYHIFGDNSLRFTGSLANQGNYVCIASNSYGSAKRDINVDYIVPVAIQPPKRSQLEVHLGQHLALPCKADGHPQPNIEWLFYSSDTKSTKKVKASDASGSLNLGALQLNHDGYYTCIATNKESAANVTYQVGVLAPPHIDPSLKKEYKAVLDDLVVTIPCKAVGIPKPDITWTKNGRNLPAGTKWYDIDKDGSIVIKDIDNKSSGAYVCHARNKLGTDNKSFHVIVRPYPDGKIPMKTIYLEDGAEGSLPCDVPHSRMDRLRWFKDQKIIAIGDYTLNPVKAHHSGDYICHVSTFINASSAGVRVVVGFKPKFVTEPDIEIAFEKDRYTFLDCEAYGIPTPTATWIHNGKKIGFTNMLNEFLMTPDSVGKYTCVVSNNFGSVNRSFEIFSSDCFLNIREDFKIKQPLLIEMPYHRLPQFENSDSHIHVPSGQHIQLYCPSKFKMFPKTEVTAVCQTGNFEIDGTIYKYSELSCQDEINPQIKRTRRECRSKNTELIKIGFEKRGTFLDAYKVCLDKHNNVPVYIKQKVQRSLANVNLNYDAKWFDDDLLEYESDEIYDCTRQFNHISGVLRRRFHTSGKCCFKDRQLIGPRDLLPGLSQKAAFTHLNVIPQWSTCGSENWDHLENDVRKLAKSSYDGLTVWTGTSGQLSLIDVDGEYQMISLKDEKGHLQTVPNYLWKVIQDLEMKASLAVVQLNIPDLSLTEAYKHVPCKDICKDIPWLNGTDWHDTTKGFTFCCKLQDFEKAFGYEGEFGDDKAILRYSSIISKIST